MAEYDTGGEKTRLFNEQTFPKDMNWLLHADSAHDSHPLLLDLSRAIGVTLVMTLLFHLAKNL